MDDQSINEIVAEIAPLLTGRAAGKIFQLSTTSLAVDFGLRSHGDLFISVAPASPRLYLIKRRIRDLEKQSQPLAQFGLTLKKELANTRVKTVKKDPNDRIVRFDFAGTDEVGDEKAFTLIAQLTGRSANLLLLDDKHRVIQVLRAAGVAGQRVGEVYDEPGPSARSSAKAASPLLEQIRSGKFASPSEAADAYFTSLIAQRESAARLATKRAELRRKISQQQKLLKHLEADWQTHTGAEKHKKVGDLLLANLSTAKRLGDRVRLSDYFADNAPEIEIELDENLSLQEEAARRFELYSRSKRALGQIELRIGLVKSEIEKLEEKFARLESETSVLHEGPLPAASRRAPETKQSARVPGTRRYISSDGFEILVGRTSHDNDFLTFKVGKPNDLWLHAADYGGSHVVVRNSTRKDVPPRTLIEAAQIAAYFSQARQDPKVDVHYTQRKFVSKPKGAKPGLVRMQRFKNITVAPIEAGTRS